MINDIIDYNCVYGLHNIIYVLRVVMKSVSKRIIYITMCTLERL